MLATVAASWAPNITVCVGAQRCGNPATLRPAALRRWHSDSARRPPPALGATCRKAGCTASRASPGRRPCSRSSERQETFVLGLAAALGVGSGGFFLEVGGHDGVRASNTVFAEACEGWRGLLIEANPASFARLLASRPGVLALRSAVCDHHGTVEFAARRSMHAWRTANTSVAAADETGGVVSYMNKNFEKAGYAVRGPTAWLRTQRALRFAVPCAPLSHQLALLQLRRVDVFWCDVEGAELQVLRSVDFAAVSFGIVVVEMRYNDATRNRRVYDLLYAAGFELVRSLRVWEDKILDNVFVNLRHFGTPGADAREPGAALVAEAASFLGSLPRNVPFGANTRLLDGKHAGGRYRVSAGRGGEGDGRRRGRRRDRPT